MKKFVPLYEVDRFRMVAAFLVVAIHVSPLQEISREADFLLTRVVARIGVPFFFMISGYFVIAPYYFSIGTQEKRKQEERVNKSLKKMMILYAVATLIYIPIHLYSGYFKGEFSVAILIKDIVFNGTFYHLWYLPASIIGIWIMMLLCRRLNEQKVWIVVGILYGIGLFGDSYYGVAEKIPVLQKAYEIIFQIVDYTRNGIFFTPVFIMLGISVYNHEKKYLNEQYPTKRLLIFSSIALIIMSAEAFLLRGFHLQRHDSMYVALLPVMYYLFLYLIVVSKEKQKTRGYVQRMSSKSMLYKEASMIIYIIHPFIIVLVRAFAKVTGLKKLLVENSIVLYLMVCIGSFLTAYLFIRVKFHLKSKYEIVASKGK